VTIPNPARLLPQYSRILAKKNYTIILVPMTDLSTIFGRPGEGIHEHYELAIKDIAMTGAAAVLIAKVFNKSILGTFCCEVSTLTHRRF
jgi:hypothetical protein